jgi:hypothetical protein
LFKVLLCLQKETYVHEHHRDAKKRRVHESHTKPYALISTQGTRVPHRYYAKVLVAHKHDMTDCWAPYDTAALHGSSIRVGFTLASDVLAS